MRGDGTLGHWDPGTGRGRLGELGRFLSQCPSVPEIGCGQSFIFFLAGVRNPAQDGGAKLKGVSGMEQENKERIAIDLPHGGYRKLIAYRKSETIYQGTVVFCRRFLPPRGDRTVDQMTQAARSCKQNIAEGSAASGTSKETEIHLTGVARATLDELREDYLDRLRSMGAKPWPAEDRRTRAARKYAARHPDWDDWRGIFESRPEETLCNVMVVLCHQAHALLGGMVRHQEEEFRRLGGIRERMHAARMEARGEAWNKAAFSRLESAGSPEELARRAREMRAGIGRMERRMREQRGWEETGGGGG